MDSIFHTKTLTFLLFLFTINATAQTGTLELLQNREFRYSKSEWHILDKQTIKKSYQKQYSLELNKQDTKTVLEIRTLDIDSRNKNYPERKTGEVSSVGELKHFKEDLTERFKADSTVTLNFIKSKAYKEFKIILAKKTNSSNPETITYYAAARNVIHRFFIIAVTLEEAQCKSIDDARKQLIAQIKQIKDNN
ncbi:MAG: hypothetical protein HRT72_13975 [Flavobacteriales bacterium]|nr:hypothetical protein [Flavobacteriales bacterium]